METQYVYTIKIERQLSRCSRCGSSQAVSPRFGAALRPACNARGKNIFIREVLEEFVGICDELVEIIFQLNTCAFCENECRPNAVIPINPKLFRQNAVDDISCFSTLIATNKVSAKYNSIEIYTPQNKTEQKFLHINQVLAGRGIGVKTDLEMTCNDLCDC